MKARDAIMRIKRNEADTKNRKVADLENMIRDFDAVAADLDRQIQAEEDRTGIRDTRHFSYSTFAKSAAQRRDNLRASTGELRVKLEAAIHERDDALENLARATAASELREEIRPNRRRSERLATAVMR